MSEMTRNKYILNECYTHWLADQHPGTQVNIKIK